MKANLRLIVLCLALAVVGALVLTDQRPAADEPVVGAVQRPARAVPAAAPPPPSTRTERYSAERAQAPTHLFSAQGAAPVVPMPTDDAASEPPPGPRFVGTWRDAHGLAALMEDDNGGVALLKGAEWSGYRIDQVEPDRVRLTHLATGERLDLHHD